MAPTGDRPKHKPSQRLTLEEILHSLQDMVRNELAEVGAKPAEQPAAPSFPPLSTHSPQEIETGLKQVLHTLVPEHDRSPEHAAIDTAGAIPEIANPPEALADAGGLPDLSTTLEVTQFAPDGGERSEHEADMPEPVIPHGEEAPPAEPEVLILTPSPLVPAARPTPPPATAPAQDKPPKTGEYEAPAAVPAGGQTALPFLEPEPPPAGAREEAREIVATVPDAAPQASSPSRSTGAPTQEVRSTPMTPMPGWDDIPVLHNAVFVPPPETPPPEPAAGSRTGAPVQFEVPLPPATTAREIAIQVAARVNVELRRSGRRGLSSDVIARLALLLREALAQAAANRDNSAHKEPPKKR